MANLQGLTDTIASHMPAPPSTSPPTLGGAGASPSSSFSPPAWARSLGQVSIKPEGNEVGKDFAAWSASASPDKWIVQDDSEDQMTYVNLQENPHGYTGGCNCFF